MIGGAEREDALLGAGLFLIAPGAAEGRVEAVRGERLFQRVGLHDAGIDVRAVVERIDVVAHAVLIGVLVEGQAEIGDRLVAKGDHLAELPRRVDVQQREGRLGRIKRLQRQMQHDRRILADRIEHDRVFELGRDLAHDEDRLGFEPSQMGHFRRTDQGHRHPGLPLPPYRGGCVRDGVLSQSPRQGQTRKPDPTVQQG